MSDGYIKLYTGNTCNACITLKKTLARLNLTDYTECDIADDHHRDAILALGHRSIPVLVRYNYLHGVCDSMGGSDSEDVHYADFFELRFEGPEDA